MGAEGFPNGEVMRSPINRKYLGPLLLLLVSLSFVCLASTSAQVYNERASILSSDYTIQGDTLLLKVKVSYSYSSEQWMKVIVQTSSPAQDYEKTIKVGPGTDVREVDFELKPVPSTDTWLASISLDKSNADGANLDVLQLVDVYMDIKGARENQNQLGLGVIVLIVGAIVLVSALYVSGKRRSKSRIELKDRKRGRHNRRGH